MDWQNWPIQASPSSETPGSPDSLLRPKTPNFDDDFHVEEKHNLDDRGPQSFEVNKSDHVKEDKEQRALETRNSPPLFSSPSINSDVSRDKPDDSEPKTDYKPPNSPLHVSSQESAITASTGSQFSQEQQEKDLDLENSSFQGPAPDSQVEKTKKELDEEQRVKMQLLVAAFSEDQLDRYEMYRRSSFPKAVIKRFMQSVTGGSISQNVVIAMSGVAKVYVGEIVEKGLDVMQQWGDTGPLRPKHIREAARRLKQENKVALTRVKKTMFR